MTHYRAPCRRHRGVRWCRRYRTRCTVQWYAWIVPLTCVEDTGLALVVTAPDADHARYVRKYYQAVLEAAAGTVGRMVRLA